MRVPSSYHAAPSRQDSSMTPMIDVVFLLLVFFVWTASFQAIEKLLPSQLTKATTGGTGSDVEMEELDFEQVVVRVTYDGNVVGWIVNGQSLFSLGEVRSRLEQVANIRADLPVRIDPDDPVPLGDVMDVYDIARLLGFGSIQFAVSAT